MQKIKEIAGKFKDSETGKTGYSGVAAEGQERFKDYKQDAADGKVDWAAQGKDAIKDWKSSETGGAGAGAGGVAPAGGAPAGGAPAGGAPPAK